MFASLLRPSSSILFALRNTRPAIASTHLHPFAYSPTCFNLSANPSSSPNFSTKPSPNHKGLIKVRRRRRRRMSASSNISNVPGKEDDEGQGVKLLPAADDAYGGVIVEMQEPMGSDHFGFLLRSSLSHWAKLGKKGVWIKLPIGLANLVQVAVNEGFYYHHAEPRYLMLVSWISDCSSTLPANATHRVGVGAFVINDKKEVLVVQEKSGILRGMGIWKFPTGIAEKGEDISMAVIREVKEETGIDSKFVEILAFRQSHKSFFQKSDLYFVCLLEPLSFNIDIQQSEIEAAQWMPFEEYAAQPFVQKHELLKNIIQICMAKNDGRYSGFSEVPIKASFREGNDSMYFNRQTIDSYFHRGL